VLAQHLDRTMKRPARRVPRSPGCEIELNANAPRVISVVEKHQKIFPEPAAASIVGYTDSHFVSDGPHFLSQRPILGKAARQHSTSRISMARKRVREVGFVPGVSCDLPVFKSIAKAKAQK
jgi:hypothetical protein